MRAVQSHPPTTSVSPLPPIHVHDNSGAAASYRIFERASVACTLKLSAIFHRCTVWSHEVAASSDCLPVLNRTQEMLWSRSASAGGPFFHIAALGTAAL